MWVPVSVWQPCELLYTCYLLTYLLSCTFFVFYQCLGQARKVHETTSLLLVTLPHIQRLKKFTHALSNKPFVIWLLTNPLHLKYVATLHCDMSLRARFAIINVSQGSVATRAKCGGSFNIRLTANLPRNLPMKTFLNRPRFDRIMVMSLWPGFFVGPPCRSNLWTHPSWHATSTADYTYTWRDFRSPNVV